MEETKVCVVCRVEKTSDCFHKNKNYKDGYKSRCKGCDESSLELRILKDVKNIDPHKETSVCIKCSVEKTLINFYKRKANSNGYAKICKECDSKAGKKYRENNKGKIAERTKIYRENNKEIIAKNYKRWRNENKDILIEKEKINRQKNAKYSSYAHQLTIEENPVKDNNGDLLCECSYCKGYFNPTKIQVVNRIACLNGKGSSAGSESRLFCCDECKSRCSVFGMRNVKRNQREEPEQARCHQQTNRKALLDLQLDTIGYNFCEVCGEEFSSQDLQLHHNIMVSLDMSEADNIAHQILVCKDHHKHKNCI